MATYKQIQEYVKDNYRFVPKTCWIADVKNAHGLTTRIASNRISSKSREHPCPHEKQEVLESAFRHFGMI